LENPLTPTEEIHNRIYDFILANDPTFDMAIALGHVCRTTRAEYFPLHFRLVELCIHVKYFDRFLDAYYPSTSLFPRLPVCEIHLIFGQQDETSDWFDKVQ
jgi:hypothetical protein